MITPERVIELIDSIEYLKKNENSIEKTTIKLYYGNNEVGYYFRGVIKRYGKWYAVGSGNKSEFLLSELDENPPKTAWDDIKANMYKMNSVDPNVPQVCIAAAILKKYKDILENKPMKKD
jgi:hypothetical protein